MSRKSVYVLLRVSGLFSIYLSISISLSHSLSIYTYMYIYRERESKRARGSERERERERERTIYRNIGLLNHQIFVMVAALKILYQLGSSLEWLQSDDAVVCPGGIWGCVKHATIC